MLGSMPPVGATILVTDSSRAVLHLLSELRRLVALHRWLTAALVVAALLALGHAGLGAMRMAAR